MTAKKYLSAVLTLLMLMFALSAGYRADAADDEYTYRCSYMYDMLETRAEKQLYDSISQNCEILDNSYNYCYDIGYVSIPRGVSTERAVEIALIFIYDNPQYFWLGATYSTTWDFFMGSRISLKVIDYFMDGDVRQSAKAKIQKAEKEYLDGALKYQTDLERLLYIHDALLRDVSYALGEWDQTIASVFLQKQTVCAGYSKAFALLCNALGIDTAVIVSEKHAWNVVNLSGFWFVVDVTNNYRGKKYFLVSDKMVYDIDVSNKSPDRHKPDKDTYMHYIDSLPKCRYSYSEAIGEIPAGLLLRGDANSDGVVNVRDAAFIAKCLAKGIVSTLPKLADFNMDGRTDVRDAASLAKVLAAA